MKSLDEINLLARLKRLAWLPEGAAALAYPYTKTGMMGMASFAYLMTYLQACKIFLFDEKSRPKIKAMQCGKPVNPKDMEIRIIPLPNAPQMYNLGNNINQSFSDLRPETITSLFRLTTTFGQKLRDEAGLICRGLLKDELRQELDCWKMKIEWTLEIPPDKLPLLTFKIMHALTRVGLVQIDVWSGTFLVNEQPTQKLLESYEDFKQIIMAQVDRYLEFSTLPEQATG